MFQWYPARYGPVNRLPEFLLVVLVGVLGALAPPPAAAQPFSLICMPDPQYYTNSNHASLYDLYSRQTRWIRDNKTAYNIKHVIWLGDLTNDNTLTQWNTANAAYNILDTNNIPYAVVPGNHDYKTTQTNEWVGANLRDLTRYNDVVGPSRFVGKSWYGGNMGNTTNRNENNYTFFSASGLNFLVIGLEYAPRKEVLTWANNLISQYPTHRVIIFTHMYMTTNGNYAGGAGSATGTVGAEGADLFDECASRHSNVFMVVCGHVTESKVNTKMGVGGNTIYEMLVDYQGEQVQGTGDNLGNGWLRIMQFDPSTNKINGSTITAAPGDTAIFTGGVSQFYNGPYSTSPTAADHLFSLNYNMTAAAQPYTYLNSSVEFHDMHVSDAITADQLDPDIAQADDGRWVAAWEEDSDENGIYNIVVRGFDADGNARFASSVVNTAGVNTTNATNPAIAMAADGTFAVTWRSGTTAIKTRAYSATGTPIGVGEQSVISVTAPGIVRNPDVAMDDAGNFVVAWSDDADGNGSFQVRARGFTSSYVQRFAAKTINTIAAGQQQNPVIGMAANGDYVIAWDDDQESDGEWDLAARGYLANESQRFTQIVGNTTTTGQQLDVDIAMDDTGRFVVVWEDDSDLNNSYQIRAKGFTATGNQLISERTVNLISTGNQLNPVVAMDSAGNWYPAWQDDGAVSGGEGYQMMSNKFDISGTRINAADVRVNSVIAVTHQFGPPARYNPVVSAHKSGRYIVAWADDMDGNGSYQVLARAVGGTAKSLVVKAINGSVAKSPAEPFYAPNATVTLSASGNSGYAFSGWSGDVPAGNQLVNPLTITMNTDKSLTAQFTASTRVSDWPLY
ncbi:MAG: InlB B-repeat-containing protein [Candidatus Sumerlaeaceae bacterium]